MKSGSLQINGENWRVSVLAEQVLILEPDYNQVPLSLIHTVTKLLEKANLNKVNDLIPGFENIAMVYESLIEDLSREIEIIQQSIEVGSQEFDDPQTIEVPVCYELGLDWEIVESHTGFSREEVIQKHMRETYTIAMMGFMPGFLYLSGMNKGISTPRKESPRTRIPQGSIGIGGDQTGIYSLQSPGGWQIIGRTVESFFDLKSDPPVTVQPGDKLVFKRIREQEFYKLKPRIHDG